MVATLRSHACSSPAERKPRCPSMNDRVRRTNAVPGRESTRYGDSTFRAIRICPGSGCASAPNVRTAITRRDLGITGGAAQRPQMARRSAWCVCRLGSWSGNSVAKTRVRKGRNITTVWIEKAVGADTPDKLDKAAVQRCVAVMAVMAYIAADIEQALSGELDRSPDRLRK